MNLGVSGLRERKLPRFPLFGFSNYTQRSNHQLQLPDADGVVLEQKPGADLEVSGRAIDLVLEVFDGEVGGRCHQSA